MPVEPDPPARADLSAGAAMVGPEGPQLVGPRAVFAPSMEPVDSGLKMESGPRAAAVKTGRHLVRPAACGLQAQGLGQMEPELCSVAVRVA